MGRPGGEQRPRRGKLIVGAVAAVAVLALVAAGLVVASGGGGGDTPETTLPVDVGPTTPEATVDLPGNRRTTSTVVEAVTTSVAVAGVPARLVSATATVTAPNNVDRCGNPTSYEPLKAADGDLATAWRAPGDATGAFLTFTLAAPAVVTRVGLVPGFAKVDPCDGTDRFPQNRRISRVQWRVAGKAFEHDLQDAPGMQTVAIPAGVLTSSVGLLVQGTRPPGDRDFTAISEVLVEVQR